MSSQTTSLSSIVAEPVDPGPNLAAVVSNARLVTHPFDHIYVEEAFPPEFYQELLSNLPDLSKYHELHHRDALMPDGRSARRRFWLYPEHIMMLPGRQRRFWSRLLRHLRSPELQDAFKHKFRNALEKRFGPDLKNLRLDLVAMLFRDLAGYKIRIHPDVPTRVITVQFYLPKDVSQRHLGTIFHEGPDGEAAERTQKLAFLPASGYAFVVTDHSWHSVTPLPPGGEPRDSLLLIYYQHISLLRRVKYRLVNLKALLLPGLHKSRYK
jgi:hypothetical protein